MDTSLHRLCIQLEDSIYKFLENARAGHRRAESDRPWYLV